MNEVRDLAQWFVREVLGRRWTQADYRGVHMKHASQVLKLGYALGDVKACIMAMIDFPEGFEAMPEGLELKYILTVTKGEPPYIEQFLAIPDPPPVYEIDAYDDWVKKYGSRAVGDGVWDGVYLPINQPYRLTEDDIAAILGESYAQVSLEERGRLLCARKVPLTLQRSGRSGLP